ncbi:hypothetical protein ONZ45_g19416 [Pleurotus djamor]|nr:hypothetical protein ONZ45_g19416 [Pleurotus djamor]
MTQPLPPELFIQIGELLPADGVCNLSLTCRQYRSLLIHTVFRHIVVDNDSIFQLENFLQIEGVRNAVIHITLRHITPPNDHDEGQHSPDYRQLGLVFPDTKSLKIEIIDDFTPSFKDLPIVIEQFLDMKMPALETLYLSLVNREVPIVSLPEVPALPPLKNLSITWEAECEPVHFEEIYSDLISQLIPHPSSTLIAFTLKAKAGPFIEDFDGLQSILALMPNIKRISFTGPVLRIEVPEDKYCKLQPYGPLRAAPNFKPSA